MRKEIIGDAELWLGDCLEILPTLDNVDAVVTDPPYGMGFNGWDKGNRKASIKSAGGSYGKKWDKIIGDDKPFNPEVIINMGVPVIMWGANHYASRLPDAPGWLVWDKSRGGTISKDFTWSHCELAWCNATGQCVSIFDHLWNGFRRQSEVGEHLHPTQKPTALMGWCLSFVPDAQTILDPFMGSGTTGVACANLGRKFIGIEIEEKYFDIACERIEAAQAQGRLFE